MQMTGWPWTLTQVKSSLVFNKRCTKMYFSILSPLKIHPCIARGQYTGKYGVFLTVCLHTCIKCHQLPSFALLQFVLLFRCFQSHQFPVHLRVRAGKYGLVETKYKMLFDYMYVLSIEVIRHDWKKNVCQKVRVSVISYDSLMLRSLHENVKVLVTFDQKAVKA